MPFVSAKCTDELFQELKIPESLKIFWDGETVIGQTIIYDDSIPAALILEPFHPKGDGEYCILCIDGKSFNIHIEKERWRPINTQVSVSVSEETKEIDDEYLKNVTCQALKERLRIPEEEFEIRIKGRKPPFSPRPHSKLIDAINRAVKYAEALPSEEAREMFSPEWIVRVCVQPEELESFIQYGKQTSWEGLSPEAIEIMRIFLTKREA